MHARVRAVLTGRVVALGPKAVASGIFKQPRSTAVAVEKDGLSGDEQGDLIHHGGREKAIHHYPFDHYHFWSAERPQISDAMVTGAFGENISTEGITEVDICVGDVFQLGTALVQVSQGRQPCWRLNERFGDIQMARSVQKSGRTGWYYRVLEPGAVKAGDELVLLQRGAVQWTIGRIWRVLFRDTLNYEALAELADLPVLASAWRDIARRRLERHCVEDWSARLDAPQ